MIDIKKAKVRLLSLAFHGALIDYSKKEKQNDALDALHKTAKNYSPVSEDEYLIDSPSFWNWSRLAYVTNNHGQTVPDKDFCYIDVGTLDNVHQRLAAKENLVTAKDAPSRARKIVQVGDVLYSTVRPYLHNICIVDREFSRMPIASTAFCVMQPNERVLLNKFLFYWLLTPEFDKYSNGDPSKGALYPAIGEKDLLRGVIPIPSIEEQSLIVEKIDAAFSALDTIDTLQAQYADNLTALKAKLIDAAIQGKLTEQLTEDGTAEELYKQIQTQKQTLIKAGKIKKEKQFSEITEDEKPFKIPRNWRWVSVGNVCINIQYGSSKKSSASGKMAVLRMGNIQAGKIVYDKLVYTSDDEEIAKYPLEKDDLLFNRTNSMELVGKAAIYKGEMPAIYAGYLIRITPLIMVSSYLNYVMQSKYYWEFCRTVRIDSNGQSNINAEKLKQFVFPLPPLMEQERIVTKLDAVFKAIEELNAYQ